MPLLRLGLRDFRCFAHADLALDERYNLITGENASGKTSLLEAFFFLAQGRSFRTARLDALPRTGSGGFQIVGRARDTGGREVPLGIARTGRVVEARLAGAPARSLAELAQTLPVLVIDSEVHRLLDDGPRYRRRFLDWGTFHVEHGFLADWRRYQRALRQRNEALRTARHPRELSVWNRELASTGEALDRHRARYMTRLTPVATELARLGLAVADVALDYRRGWPADQPLAAAIAAGWERDRAFGATQTGPHRADILIKVEGLRAQDRVSRGQHKMLAAALVLAQGRVFQATTGRQPSLLLDDMPAELDGRHLDRLLALLADQPGQLVLTVIREQGMPVIPGLPRPRVFHVEQGAVQPVGQG